MAGGTDYPKVEDLDGLADYGNSVLNFAESYTSAVNQTYRTYGDATSYQNGAAIEAFLTKLETLQSQLFDQFPLALETYGNTVAIYYSALTGEGFQNRMWSDTTGASELNTRYTSGDQKVAIDETTHRLKAAFDHAAELAEVEAPDLNGIKTSALDAFESAGKKRTTKASSVDSAWTSFTSNLSSNAATIKAFQAVIDNAMFLSQVPAETLVGQIISGGLSAEEMWYLDQVTNKEDAKVLDDVLKNDWDKVLTRNPNKVSDGMFNVLANEVTVMVMNKDGESLTKVANAIGKTEEEKARAFSENMLYAGDRLAAGQIVVMGSLYEQGIPSEELSVYQNRLDAINQANGLFETIILNEAWLIDDPKAIKNAPGYIAGSKSDSAAIEANKSWHEFSITVDGSLGLNITDTTMVNMDSPTVDDVDATKDMVWSTRELESDIQKSDKTYDEAQLQEEAYELDEKRNKAKSEYVESLVKSGTSTAVNVGTMIVAPEIAPVVAAVTDGSADGMVDLVNDNIQEGLDGTHTRLAKGADTATALIHLGSGFLGYYKNYVSQIAALDQEELKLRNENEATLFNKGGWSLKENSNTDYRGKDSVDGTNTVATSREHYNDFGAVMREKYLDDYGVTEYLSDEELAQYRQYLIETGKYDQATIDYLTDPNNTPENYANLNWEQVNDALGDMNDAEISGKSNEEFQAELDDKYIVE